jgi:hypothetical protein
MADALFVGLCDFVDLSRAFVGREALAEQLRSGQMRRQLGALEIA